MKVKEEHHLRRHEVADKLRKLADMLDTANVNLRELSIKVPEHLGIEIELEEEADEGELEIELKWRVAPVDTTRHEY